MIGAIFQTIATAITQFTSALTNVFNGLAGMFYDSTNSEMTMLGTLLLIAAGVGIVYWGFGTIKGLIKRA